MNSYKTKRLYDWKPKKVKYTQLPELDKIPKKTIAQQIADSIELNDVLQESYLRSLNMVDIPDDADIDEMTDFDSMDHLEKEEIITNLDKQQAYYEAEIKRLQAEKLKTEGKASLDAAKKKISDITAAVAGETPEHPQSPEKQS